jgi:hypothetical protein
MSASCGDAQASCQVAQVHGALLDSFPFLSSASLSVDDEFHIQCVFQRFMSPGLSLSSVVGAVDSPP